MCVCVCDVLKGDTLFPLLNGYVDEIPEILMGKRSAKLMLPVKVWKFLKFDGKKNMSKLCWLVVWNMNFIFPHSWDDDPI